MILVQILLNASMNDFWQKRFMEKMVQLSTLHIWINSHIFQNITIFMK